jgi:hypothetical protein
MVLVIQGIANILSKSIADLEFWRCWMKLYILLQVWRLILCLLLEPRFSIFIEDNTRQLFRFFRTHQWWAFPFVDSIVVTAVTAELKSCWIIWVQVTAGTF